MTKPGDALALYLILLILFYLVIRNWLPITFSKWLKSSAKDEEEEFEGEIPDLLRSHGYQVKEAKVKIPLTTEIVNDKEYESRLYIDYIATAKEDEHETYLVFREREKKPLEKTGARLRDRFLPFYLLYRPQGILFVTRDRQLLRIEMDVPDYQQRRNPYQQWIYISVFLAGMLLHWFMT